MTVWFGTNDASTGHYVPLAEYKENLVDILVHLLEKFGVEDSRLLLICPSPVVEAVASSQRKVRGTVLFCFVLFSEVCV